MSEADHEAIPKILPENKYPQLVKECCKREIVSIDMCGFVTL